MTEINNKFLSDTYGSSFNSTERRALEKVNKSRQPTNTGWSCTDVKRAVPSKGHMDEFHFRTDCRKAMIRRRKTLEEIDEFATGQQVWLSINGEKME